MKGFQTICISDHMDDVRSNVTPHLQPIYATSSFVYPGAQAAMDVFQGKQEAYIYSRWDNPSYQLVERKIAKLETYGSDLEASALLFTSGMAAISAAIMSLGLRPGDSILAPGDIYGTATDLMNVVMQQQGVTLQVADLTQLDQVEAKLQADPSIKLLYIETPANPTLTCYDIAALAQLAQKHNIKTIADNTFATPYLQRPLLLGVDMVVHSATKYLNGHGNALGGMVVSTDRKHMATKVLQMRKLLGGNASAFDAFLLNNGLKTLVLRMEQHNRNAQQVAEFLAAHPAVSKVNYPGLPDHPSHALASQQMSGFGGSMSFELKGGLKAGIKMMDAVKVCVLTASIGTVDTLIQHPASMTHVMVPKEQRDKFNITDGLIRLSVGIELVEDIIADLDQAMS